jgi:hypothetical protein
MSQVARVTPAGRAVERRFAHRFGCRWGRFRLRSSRCWVRRVRRCSPGTSMPPLSAGSGDRCRWTRSAATCGLLREPRGRPSHAQDPGSTRSCDRWGTSIVPSQYASDRPGCQRGQRGSLAGAASKDGAPPIGLGQPAASERLGYLFLGRMRGRACFPRLAGRCSRRQKCSSLIESVALPALLDPVGWSSPIARRKVA